MDSSFVTKDKEHDSKSSFHQILDINHKFSSVSKKKNSISKFINPDSNLKKIAKPNLNDFSNHPARQASKKSVGTKTPEPKKSSAKPESKKKNPKRKKVIQEASPKKRVLKQPKNLIELASHLQDNSFIKKEISILLKEKSKKKSQDNSKHDEKIKKAEIKQYLADLNKITREENFRKFKHEKFKPKCAWGKDERKIAAVRHCQDPDLGKKSLKTEKDRSKSAEKGQVRHEEDFKKIKKKKSENKKLKINKKEFFRPQTRSPKKNKSLKTLKKKATHKIIDMSYEENLKSIWKTGSLDRSKTPDNREKVFKYQKNGRESFFFGESEKKEKKTEETVQPTNATLNITECKDSYLGLQTEEDTKDCSNLDISKRKEDIKKKLNDLRVKVEVKKQKSVDFELLFKSAVKIQAHVRGWLTRLRFQKYLLDLEDSRLWTSYRQNFSSEPSEQKESSSIVSSKEEKLQVDASLILKTENEWRDLQKAKLTKLKNKDFEDMKNIAKKIGSEELLMPFFEEIIERRYAGIDQMFEEHVKAVKDVITGAPDQSDISDPTDELDDSGEDTVGNMGLDFRSLKFYSENEEQSVRISELDMESDKLCFGLSGRTEERNSVELSLQKISFIKQKILVSTPKTSSEPDFPLIQSEAIDICEMVVLVDLFSETLEEAWQELLLNTDFINAISEKILSKLLNQELEALRIKQPILDRLLVDDQFIETFVKSTIQYLSKIRFELDPIVNSSNAYNPIDYLNLIQESDIGVLINKRPNVSPIPLSIFARFSSDNSLSGNYLIVSRLLFETFNELLLKRLQKPDPLPWSTTTSLMLTPYKSYLSIIPSVLSELKYLNRIRAGKLPNLDFPLNSKDSEGEVLSQMREDHLSCVLAFETISQEPEWLDYQFEETQVTLDLSDMVLEDIVEQTLLILNSYNN